MCTYFEIGRVLNSFFVCLNISQTKDRFLNSVSCYKIRKGHKRKNQNIIQAMLFKEILDQQINSKQYLINKIQAPPIAGISIVISNNRIQQIVNGEQVHSGRRKQYVALIEKTLLKYKVKNSLLNINLADEPIDGHFNFCRKIGNSRQFLLPNHRFTNDDIIFSTETYDDIVKLIRNSRQDPYESRKSQFYTNCIPHKSKVDYFAFAVKNPAICTGFIYSNSSHKTLSLTKEFIRDLELQNLIGDLPALFEEHLKYKYVIYNDGNTLSDRMRLLLLTDSVIVRKSSPYEEFYSYLLKPDQNYIQYNNVEELPEIHKRLEADIPLCNSIRKNNQQFVDTYLKYDNILEYVANLINGVC